jgi:hypothetical protein
MSSNARLNKYVEAIDVTVDVNGQPIKAVVTRQALEVLWAMPDDEPAPMLASFHANQAAIESAIVDRYTLERRQPVMVHVRQQY